MNRTMDNISVIFCYILLKVKENEVWLEQERGSVTGLSADIFTGTGTN